MKYWLYIITITMIYSCSVTKHLPAGEKLYTGAEVIVEDNNLSHKKKKALSVDLKSLIRPQPNTTFLGFPYKLWIHENFGKPGKEKGLGNWIRKKFGQPPVLVSNVNIERYVSLLKYHMENEGYFNASATGDTISRNKRVKAVYTVRPSFQYTIRKVVFPNDTSSVLEKTMAETAGQVLLKPNDPYNLDKIIAERQRIDEFLKRNGFYFFSPNYLLMRVDSTAGNHAVDIFITVKKETPKDAKRKYYINNIFVYPNYAIDEDITLNDSSAVRYKDFYLIDPEHKFKPKVFDHTMLFNRGELYNRRDHNLTLSRLANIGVFKFVKNRFEVVAYHDTGRLNAYYYLTPQKFKSLRLEVTGKSNSAGFAGTELQGSWRHRNISKSAELLALKAYSGFDFQVQGVNQGYNIFRLGGEMNFVWPQVMPFHFKSTGAYIPRTQLTIGYDWQDRQKLYMLNTFRTAFGYVWKQSERSEHDLSIVNITYTNSSNVTQEYLDRIKEDSSLARVIQKQLIIGPTYSYTYTNTTRPTNRNGFYYNAKLDFSGNLLGVLQGADAKNGNVKTLLEVPYSQYFKTEHDGRYYLRLGGNRANQWANRLFAGVGIPYGNSTELPFIKQFFTGGTNSLRGFPARTVGPGTYRPTVDPNSFIPDQTGDIKLELNSELRFKIISVINGAVFTDFGNIWLKNENSYKPGAQFSGSFMKELAADAGVGLRFDFNIIVIRTDFAIPIRKPWLPENERWVINKIDFGSSQWRQDNIIFNLGIGMPF